ncbi:MAG: chitobiase/beta-hexosaminidase C-terminal domain-containing protein [Opitutaceae bacterium]
MSPGRLLRTAAALLLAPAALPTRAAPVPGLTIVEVDPALPAAPGGNPARYPTLAAARDHVRSLPRAQREGRVEVRLAATDHVLAETVVFTLADAPPEPGRLVITSRDDRPAVLRGSLPVSGWRRLAEGHPELPPAAAGHVWVAPIPTGATEKVRALFGPDGRLPRARSGQLAIRGRPADHAGRWDARHQFSFPSGMLRPAANLGDVELGIVPGRQFMMNLLELEALDADRGIARTRLPGTFTLLPYAGGLPETGWIENSLQFLDSPGEWVADRRRSLLYLWPRAPEDLSAIRAAAAVELIRVEGNIDPAGRDTPVRGIEFRRLTFTESNRYAWHERTAGLQHDFELHDAPNALVRFRGAEDGVVEDCTFTDAGATGLRLDLHARGIRVIGNRFNRLGGAGIVVAGYGPGTKDVNGRHEIAHNAIARIGQDYRVSPGIMLFQSADNHVHHNLLHDLPYMGIVLSGAWPNDWRRGDSRERARTIRREETQAVFDAAYRELADRGRDREVLLQERLLPFLHGRGNRIEHNELFAYMLRQGDGNAIYVAGNGPGNVVRGNYVHDTLGATASYAIRTDDLQSGTQVLGNLIVNVACGGLTLKHVNTFEGNVLVNLRRSDKIVHSYVLIQRGPSHGASLSRNVFVHEPAPGDLAPPVWFVENGGAAAATLEDLAMDGNLYWTPHDPAQARAGLAAVQARGRDAHGLAANPRFRDPARGDYRLAEDSPLRAHGVTGLHVDETGPQGPWRARVYGRLRTTLSPPAGMIVDGRPVVVTAQASHPDATLRYTLDQSEPTETSPVFAPMTFRAGAILRVRAFLPGETDTRGALASIREEDAGYAWDLGDVPPGSVPPAPLRIRGDTELVRDPVEDRVLRLRSSGRDAAEASPQLVLARRMGRGPLELAFRLRTTPATAGTLEVMSAYAHATAVRLTFVPGGLAAPGTAAPLPLPAGEWLDARVEIDLTAGRWSARFSRADQIVAELQSVPSPQPGLESVDWFGWTLDPAVASTLEVSGVRLRRAAR